MNALFTEKVKEEITDKIAGYLGIYRPIAQDLTDEIVRFLEQCISCSRLE
jgi:hypothetical protein